MAKITGTTGDDVIQGTADADTIDGSNGNDIIHGGAGDDTITSGPGTDYLYGDDGNDTLISKRGTGPDNFDGGAGIDKVNVDLAKSPVSLQVDLTDPTVLQYFGDGGSIVNVEQIAITGGTAADHFTGGIYADTLNGYDGDDVLKGGGGNDTIIGGNGYDVAVFSGPASAYTVALQSDGTYIVSSAAEGVDTLTGIETLRFSDGDRPIQGCTSSAVYWGSANGTATFTGAANIPDGLGATPGTGFTITGLTRLPDGTFWAANEGQANAADSSYTPSLVHIAADGVTKLGEISVGSKTERSLQGLVYNDGKLYVASLSERLVKIYSAADGTYLGSIAPASGTSVNGLAFDTTLNAVIIGHEDGNALGTQIEWRDVTTGAQIKTITVSHTPDHLYFDPSSGAAGSLWYTYGDSGVGATGYVVKVDIATDTEIGTYTIPNADAVEGIVVDGNQMWLANDAYYHQGNPALSRILGYTITPEAAVLNESGSSAAFTINLNQHDQTLVDGTHLVGVERLFFQGGTGADNITGGAYDDVLVGGGGNDVLNGGAGNDRLVGTDGNDTLQGGAGNDGLEGGAGTDTAVFSGAHGSYSITQLSPDSLTITDLRTGSPDGTDTASSVENFKFSDGTFTFAQLFSTAPVNQAPTAVTLSSQITSIAENSSVAGGVKVADIAIADDGLGTNTLTLSGADAASFAIRTTATGGQALYYVGNSPDYETKPSYSVTVNAADATVTGSSPVHQDYTLAVTDVNKAPTAVTLTNQVTSLAENSVVIGGVKVADVGIVDDALGTNVLSLSGADASSFAIQDTSGGGHTLYYIGASPDFETKSVYSVTVVSHDASLPAGADVHQDFTLGITDVNEAPTAVVLSNQLASLASNSNVTGGVRVADIAVTDDALGTDTLSLSGADAASFAIETTATGGHALYYVGASPNYQTKLSYAVTVNAIDTGLVGSTAVHQDYALAITSVTPVAGTTITGTAGDDIIHGGAGNDKIDGSNGNDMLYGGAGDDTITSGPGTDYLYGEDGNDTLISKRGTGPDNFDGGAGIDLVNVDLAKSAKPLSVDLTHPGTLQYFGDGGSIVNVEQIIITGGTAADHFIGGAYADTLNGYDGNDVLQGAGGNDIIDGGNGTDTAVYSGLHTAYAFTQLPSGSLQIADLRAGSPDGTDTASNVEAFQFSDGTFTLAQLLAPAPAAAVLTTPTVTPTLSLSATAVAENLAPGTAIGTLSTDTAGTYSYTLLDNDGGKFAVANNVLVAGATNIDYEQSHSESLTVRATDANGVTTDHLFTLGVTDVNEAPTAVTLSNQVTSIAENSDVTGGVKVADIMVVDDALGTNTLGLSGADANAFAIRDTATGGHALYYIGSSPDFESQASYGVTVTSHDASLPAGTDVHQDFTLGITDVNEAPTALLFGNQVTSIAENSDVAGGLKVADITVADDALGTNALSLSGANATSFAIHDTAAGGHGLYYIGASPDYEIQSSYTVTVNSDDATLPASADLHHDFTLAIADISETPTGPTAGTDVIHGTIGNDTLSGLGGDDQLFGMDGNDTLDGGVGNDTLDGGAGADTLIGGDGIDTASYASALAAVKAYLMTPTKNAGDAFGDTYSSIENLTGSNHGDTLVGDNNANMIIGGDGNDNISGGGGADNLIGGAGDDILSGNGGNDRLEGGLGNDIMAGGTGGRDWFAYTSHSWGNDTITDFENNVDVIDFRGSGETISDLTLTQQGSDVLISTLDHTSSILIQHLQLAQITSADFLFT
jgi:Ca2+-binding RTX toxin-like protein